MSFAKGQNTGAKSFSIRVSYSVKLGYCLSAFYYGADVCSLLQHLYKHLQWYITEKSTASCPLFIILYFPLILDIVNMEETIRKHYPSGKELGKKSERRSMVDGEAGHTDIKEGDLLIGQQCIQLQIANIQFISHRFSIDCMYM